jgi:beta-1,4-N-acetylglucosaminyltransferase
MVVLGAGGHASEMLRLLTGLRAHHGVASPPLVPPGIPPLRGPVTLVAAARDTISVAKARGVVPGAPVDLIPRAREVGQPFATALFTTLWAVVCAASAVVRRAPAVILCNGPGTCVPVCIVALMLRFLGLSRTRIVFVESFARVRSLSLSGRLLYPFADLFVVQWAAVHAKFPRTLVCPRIMG